MNIPHEKWSQASGGYVLDAQGKLWRIVGFIDRPAIVLDPVRISDPAEDAPAGDVRQRETVIMGTPHSKDFQWLVAAEDAGG